MSRWDCDFVRKTVEEARYLLVIIGALLVGGLVYFLAIRLLRQSGSSTTILGWLIGIGLLMRLVFLGFSPPIENDFYRYLWDGALTANGVNPYAYSPEELLQGDVSIEPDNAATLDPLIEQGTSTLKNIDHAHLRTIYPPVAQGAFALAYWLTPFKLMGLRLVYLFFDIISLVLLGLLLKKTGQSLLRLMIYWWNPLLIYEVYFNVHYDLVVASFLILFIWAIARQRFFAATFGLMLAVGAKLWPLLITPFLLFAGTKSVRHRLYLGLFFVVLLAGILLPYALAIQGEKDSGVVAYSRDWEANGWAYVPLEEMGWWLVETFESTIDGRYPARATVVGLLLLTALLLARRMKNSPKQLCHSMGIVILLMLLLSPTVYPWYYVSLIGLATIAPQTMFLLWTLLLPLSYIKWLLPDSAEWLMAWFVHVPIWFLLAWSVWQDWKKRRCVEEPSHV